MFENKIVQLFENDVAPRELQERLDTAYTILCLQFDAVKRYYIENYPNVATSEDDITDESIFASFINEDISRDIIEQRINITSWWCICRTKRRCIIITSTKTFICRSIFTLAQQLQLKQKQIYLGYKG